MELPVPVGVGELLGTPTGLFAVGWNQAAVWVLDPDSGALRATVNVSGGELISEAYADDGTVWATGNCGDVVPHGLNPCARHSLGSASATVSQANLGGSTFVD